MRKILFIILLCNLSGGFYSLHAQQTPTAAILAGTVFDGETPIEFATVSILQAKDSMVVTGAVTDAEGSFIVKDFPLGNYLVKVDFLGYESQTFGPMKFTAQQPLQKLPKVELVAAAQQLDEAEVTAERNMLQLGLDRKIFNVEKSDLAKGGTATDVLRNVPTLDVDQDGNIRLRGNTGITVLINGKPSTLTGASRKAILDQIPASMVKSVEIITNPSAKYDPDGISGIINIVLKKNKLEGFSTNLSYSIGTLGDKHNAMLGLNYRKGKVNLFGSYNFNYNRNFFKNEVYRSTFDSDTSFYLNQNRYGRRRQASHFAKVGMDYSINDKNSLSLSATVTPQSHLNRDTIEYEFMDENRELTASTRRDGAEATTALAMEYNLNYTANFKKPKQQMVLDVNYSNYNAESYNQYDTWNFDHNGALLWNDAALQVNSPINDNQIVTVQLDYTHPFPKWNATFETGAKSIIRDINNDFVSEIEDVNGELVVDDNVSNHFNYKEQVHAGYVTFGQKVKKFTYQLGLRLEQALTQSNQITTGETYNYNYFSFFPSAHLNYQLPKMQQLQLAYSRRINRPSVQMLNPFLNFTDPLNLHQGNPYLRPEYIHSVELNYAKYWKKGSLTTSLYYRHSSDVFRRMFFVDEETGVGRVQFINFNSSQSYGLEAVTSLKLTKWWRANASANVYTMQEDGTNIGSYTNNALWGHSNVGSMFTLPKGFGIQANVFYRFPLQLVIGDISEMIAMNFSVSKQVLKGKGQLTFRISDPFLLQRFDITLQEDHYIHESLNRWESRVAYLSFTFNFGKMDMKTRSRLRNNGGGNGGGSTMGM